MLSTERSKDEGLWHALPLACFALALTPFVGEGTIGTTRVPHLSDVPSDIPFYNYVETAYNRHIIAGHSGGSFRWVDNASRAHVSKTAVLAGDFR